LIGFVLASAGAYRLIASGIVWFGILGLLGKASAPSGFWAYQTLLATKEGRWQIVK